MSTVRRFTNPTVCHSQNVDLRRHYAAWIILALAMILLGWMAISRAVSIDRSVTLANQEAFSAYRSAASEASR